MISPFHYLNLNISGRPAAQFGVVAAFVILVAIFAPISFANASPGTSMDAIWLGIVSAAQAFFILLMAPNAIRKAVLRDYQTGMMESHRITPMSNAAIVYGYLTGPVMQVMMLYGVCLLMGGFFAARAGAATLGTTSGAAFGLLLPAWYVSQAFVLMLAILLWAISLLAAVASAGKANLMGVIVLIAVFGGWGVVFLVPGAALILGLLGVGSLFNVIQGRPITAWGSVVAAALLQVGIAGICLWATARKLRAPERSLFSFVQGVLLLGLWAIALVAGLRYADALRWIPSRSADAWGTHLQVAASIIAFLAVALLTVAALVSECLRADVASRHGVGSSAAAWMRATAGLALLSLGALGVWLALVWVGFAGASDHFFGPYSPTVAPACVAVACAAMLATSFGIMYWLLSRGRRLLLPLLLILGALNGVPVLADGLAAFQAELRAEGTGGDAMGGFSVFAPVGTFLLLAEPPVTLIPGLIVQCLLAVVFGGVALRARRAVRASVPRKASPAPSA